MHLAKWIEGCRGSSSQGSGIDRDLDHECVLIDLGLHSRTNESAATAHQLVQPVRATWNLDDQPGLQNLEEIVQMGSAEQVEEGGSREPALEILAQRLQMPLGSPLQITITGAAATAENPQHSHQQE